MFSRDPPQFGINDVDHTIQRFRTAVVPRRQHSGNVVVSLSRHADGHPIKKDRRALTLPASFRGIEIGIISTERNKEILNGRWRAFPSSERAITYKEQ